MKILLEFSDQVEFAILAKKRNKMNKLAKLGDAIAISKSETINDPLTDPLTHPLTGVTARRCYHI